jgi:hypothetical protein
MHGIETIRGMNSRNQEAARIMEQHGHSDAAAMLRQATALAGQIEPSMVRENPDVGAVEARFAKTNPLEGGVQPWSAGSLFPGVISVTVQDNGEKRFTAHYRGQESVAFRSRASAENWIASRKAEFSKGVGR